MGIVVFRSRLYIYLAKKSSSGLHQNLMSLKDGTLSVYVFSFH